MAQKALKFSSIKTAEGKARWILTDKLKKAFYKKFPNDIINNMVLFYYKSMFLSGKDMSEMYIHKQNIILVAEIFRSTILW